MRENIILIGMPASGKSTVGVVLAKALGYDFVDTDLLIQREKKARLEDIISREGNEAFLETEERVCCALSPVCTVIATGGSVVYSEKAMKHFKEIGKVVYLKVEYETLKNRLHDLKARGVVLPEGISLQGLYEERTVLYEQYADITVDESGLGLEATMAKTKEMLLAFQESVIKKE